MLKMFLGLAATVFGTVYICSNLSSCRFSQNFVKAMEFSENSCKSTTESLENSCKSTTESLENTCEFKFKESRKKFKALLRKNCEFALKDLVDLYKSLKNMHNVQIDNGGVKKLSSLDKWKLCSCAILNDIVAELSHLMFYIDDYMKEYDENISVIISNFKKSIIMQTDDVEIFLRKVVCLLPKLSEIEETLGSINNLVYLISVDDIFKDEVISKLFSDVVAVRRYLEYQVPIISEIKEIIFNFLQTNGFEFNASKGYKKYDKYSKQVDKLRNLTCKLPNIKDISDSYKFFEINESDVSELGEFNDASKSDYRFNEKILKPLFKYSACMDRKFGLRLQTGPEKYMFVMRDEICDIYSKFSCLRDAAMMQIDKEGSASSNFIDILGVRVPGKLQLKEESEKYQLSIVNKVSELDKKLELYKIICSFMKKLLELEGCVGDEDNGVNIISEFVKKYYYLYKNNVLGKGKFNEEKEEVKKLSEDAFKILGEHLIPMRDELTHIVCYDNKKLLDNEELVYYLDDVVRSYLEYYIGALRMFRGFVAERIE